MKKNIQFINEDETNKTLPYLVILLHYNNNELKFSVHCKSTNKNNLINFYYHHVNKIKSGILIGFYLKALRICSPEYIHEEEEEYIKNTFKLLHCPIYT